MKLDHEKIRTIDAAIVATSKRIKVLSILTWPQHLDEEFVNGWQKGNPKLPKIKITPPDLSKEIAELAAIRKQLDESDPLEKFLEETAESYQYAAMMLHAVGTREFTEHSIHLYGRPDLVYKSQKLTAVDAATRLLETTDRLLGNMIIEDTVFNITAQKFADWLTPKLNRFFKEDKVEVVLDPTISSKALAGASRVRLRSTAMFSELDKNQLLEHEAFVHSATQLNGRKQTNLQCMGLGAPRTTRTQEGIAVLAETLTTSIDILRLRRVALRVVAVKMALDGADFIEVFKFFLDAGQSEIESARSTQRVFRGGAVKDGIVFTKDGVYLQGLIEVTTFMFLAIQENRPDLINNLFAGRLTIADTIRMTPLFKSGWLKPATYIPFWASDLRRLSAMLAYFAFFSNINLDKPTFDKFVKLEEILKEE